MALKYQGLKALFVNEAPSSIRAFKLFVNVCTKISLVDGKINSMPIAWTVVIVFPYSSFHVFQDLDVYIQFHSFVLFCSTKLLFVLLMLLIVHILSLIC